jgi:hypothetical protein
MALRKREIQETETGRTRSYHVENSILEEAMELSLKQTVLW